MFLCVKCRREMFCAKNSVGADYGNGHIYPSDKFACPKCGSEILVTNIAPIYDPKYNTQDVYLEFKKPRD